MNCYNYTVKMARKVVRKYWFDRAIIIILAYYTAKRIWLVLTKCMQYERSRNFIEVIGILFELTKCLAKLNKMQILVDWKSCWNLNRILITFLDRSYFTGYLVNPTKFLLPRGAFFLAVGDSIDAKIHSPSSPSILQIFRFFF